MLPSVLGKLQARVATIFYFKCQFQKKNYETCKVMGKWDPELGKKAVNKYAPEISQMLDLADKDFKAEIISMFKELKKITFEKLKECIRIVN